LIHFYKRIPVVADGHLVASLWCSIEWYV